MQTYHIQYQVPDEEPTWAVIKVRFATDIYKRLKQKIIKDYRQMGLTHKEIEEFINDVVILEIVFISLNI